MTIRHGSRTRTRPGRRQTHSVKRDHFAFHIMLPRSRLSTGLQRIKASRSRVLIDFVVSAIDLPSFEDVSTGLRPSSHPGSLARHRRSRRRRHSSSFHDSPRSLRPRLPLRLPLEEGRGSWSGRRALRGH